MLPELELKSALSIVGAVLLLPWSGSAQVASITEGNTFQASPHTWKRVLTNQSTSPLVAYMVGCKPKHLLTALDDALLNVIPPVSPGGNFEVEVNGPSSCNVGVRAAIFSDGHAEGDPEFVGELFARRRGACKALEQVIQRLSSVYTDHVPTEHVTEIVKRMSNGGKTGEEREGYSFAIWKINRMLAHPDHMYLIPTETRDQRLPLPTIEDVMRQNGLSHEEAHLFLLNKKLEAWKSLLQNHLEPSSTE